YGSSVMLKMRYFPKKLLFSTIRFKRRLSSLFMACIKDGLIFHLVLGLNSIFKSLDSCSKMVKSMTENTSSWNKCDFDLRSDDVSGFFFCLFFFIFSIFFSSSSSSEEEEEDEKETILPLF